MLAVYVLPSYDGVAAICVPAEFLRKNVAVVKLEPFIERENVAVIFGPFVPDITATFVAPLAGDVDVTVGAPVVNEQLYAAASGVPSAAFTVVSRFAAYVVPAVSAALGVSVALLVVAS
jgi:hypothetical protein